MNAKIIIAFILGAAAGAASSMHYFKNKYEQQADAEIQEIRDLYAKKNEPKDEKKDPAVPNAQNKADDLHATARHVAQYTKYTPTAEEATEVPVEEPQPQNGIEVEKIDFAPMKNPNPPKPYLIDSTDYGQDENFDPLCWDWYTDGVLANENDEVVDNITDWIGDNLKVFAETQDNLFWVRNEKYGVDIEVARSGISYEKAQRFVEEDRRRIK